MWERIRIELTFADLFNIANSDTSRIYIERNKVLDTDRINYVRIDDQNQMKFIASVKWNQQFDILYLIISKFAWIRILKIGNTFLP